MSSLVAHWFAYCLPCMRHNLAIWMAMASKESVSHMGEQAVFFSSLSPSCVHNMRQNISESITLIKIIFHTGYMLNIVALFRSYGSHVFMSTVHRYIWMQDWMYKVAVYTWICHPRKSKTRSSVELYLCSVYLECDCRARWGLTSICMLPSGSGGRDPNGSSMFFLSHRESKEWARLW